MSNPKPPQLYPPFAVVTETDHTAWIIIATALGLAMVLLFSLIRAYMTLAFQPRFGLEEGFLTSSTLLAIIQSSIVLGACANGLGKSIELVPAENLDKIQKMYYTSTLFFILALGLSKISIAFLLVRLTPSEKHRKVFHRSAVAIAIWAVASFFAMLLQCNLAHPWLLLNEKCPGVFLRWQIISTFDILIEVILLVMAVYLVWGLQMSFDNKMTVILSFASRLPLIIAIGFRLSTFSSEGLATNPTFLQAEFIVWTQTELCYSIIAATIPSIRPLMRVLATNYGANVGEGSGSSGIRSRTGRSAILTSGNDHNNHNDIELPMLRPKGKGDDYIYRVWTAEIPRERSTRAGESSSLTSNDSQRMIIRQNVEWEVDVQ